MQVRALTFGIASSVPRSAATRRLIACRARPNSNWDRRTSRSPARTVLAATASNRIGHGFDLHRLEPGLPLILGGVSLEHDRGCAGHSDGDAVYHCVVDALLGALSLPDIGQLFPDTDPRFKDAASHVFMTAARERMNAKGYTIGNVDVTIILERPKLSPHKASIRHNIASLLGTDVENVNVKAKTHEKVDAVGENRAVSVHAVALLFPMPNHSESAVASAAVADPVATGLSVTEGMLQAANQRATSVLQGKHEGPPLADAEGGPDGMQRLYDVIVSRRGADPSTSWTAKLFSKGRAKIAQKVGEEAVEVVIDAVSARNADTRAVVKESADLLYHLNVLWADMGIQPDDVWAELHSREGTGGITEKRGRKV
jgi:2-C-methyl-D-erythritol 2,4-cyclodiphosphate synthase